MSNSDTLSGLLTLALTLVAWYHSRDFTYYGGLFVNWVLAVLLALGLTLAVKGLLPARRNQPKEKPDPAAYRKVLATLLVLALGIAAMPWIGFVLGSIAIYTLISMLIAPTRPRSPKGWAQTLVIAAITSGVFYAVFRYVLMVPLPTGTWFG